MRKVKVAEKCMYFDRLHQLLLQFRFSYFFLTNSSNRIEPSRKWMNHQYICEVASFINSANNLKITNRQLLCLARKRSKYILDLIQILFGFWWETNSTGIDFFAKYGNFNWFISCVFAYWFSGFCASCSFTQWFLDHRFCMVCNFYYWWYFGILKSHIFDSLSFYLFDITWWIQFSGLLLNEINFIDAFEVLLPTSWVFSVNLKKVLSRCAKRLAYISQTGGWRSKSRDLNSTIQVSIHSSHVIGTESYFLRFLSIDTSIGWGFLALHWI